MSSNVAYLFNRVLADSFPCIAREIALLKQCGWNVHAFSLESPKDNLQDEVARRLSACAPLFHLDCGGLSSRIPNGGAILLGGLPLRFRKLLRADEGAGAGLEKISHRMACMEKGAGLAKRLKRLRSTHLHIYGDECALLAGLSARRLHPTGFSFTMDESDALGSVPRKFLRDAAAEATFVRCVNLVALSQVMRAADFSDWKKIQAVSDGVDLTKFAPRAFRYNPSPFDIVSVASLRVENGQAILLQAVESLIAQGRNVRLRLVGDGPDRASLERRATERKMLGFVTFEAACLEDRLCDIYARTDLFALASLTETAPMSLMEAMAMRLPCVASRVTGVADIIRDGLDGILTAPADAGALAEAIGRMMSDSELRREMGENARLRIEESYDRKKLEKRLDEVFCQNLKKSHRRSDADAIAPDQSLTQRR
jgi:glycosyltransferase involved in cell wall biosynthesis